MLFFWLLVGCGGPLAEVQGSAGGVTFGETKYVFFGGPFVVISMDEIECTQLAFARQNYLPDEAPTEDDVRILQFSWASGSISTGPQTIAPDASVAANVVVVTEDDYTDTEASEGLIDIESAEEEGEAIGTFEEVIFEDGTLSGSFTAEWCINLKDI